MTQRRSLSQALQTAELPPEALAIIEEGRPQSERERPKPTPVTPVTTIRESTEPSIARDPPGKPEALAPVSRGLVALSVRVRAELADVLLKAAFERKLQRKQPYSQQDIVIQALTQWLRKNGYE